MDRKSLIKATFRVMLLKPERQADRPAMTPRRETRCQSNQITQTINKSVLPIILIWKITILLSIHPRSKTNYHRPTKVWCQSSPASTQNQMSFKSISCLIKMPMVIHRTVLHSRNLHLKHLKINRFRAISVKDRYSIWTKFSRCSCRYNKLNKSWLLLPRQQTRTIVALCTILLGILIKARWNQVELAAHIH